MVKTDFCPYMKIGMAIGTGFAFGSFMTSSIICVMERAAVFLWQKRGDIWDIVTASGESEEERFFPYDRTT